MISQGDKTFSITDGASLNKRILRDKLAAINATDKRQNLFSFCLVEIYPNRHHG